MTPQEALVRLEYCQQNMDTEEAHCDADGILCDLLDDLGLHEVVSAYKRVDKWYA